MFFQHLIYSFSETCDCFNRYVKVILEILTFNKPWRGKKPMVSDQIHY